MATIKIKQIGSPIRRRPEEDPCRSGPGQDEPRGRASDTPEVRGAIAKLPHMVAVID
jgi:large subunit ribosomal protein L30